MNTQPNTQDKIRAALTIVATVATIVFNGIATTGYLNGVTTGDISDKYPTVITPAGYAFTIWTLIYIGILAYSIYQAMPRNLVKFRSIRSLYIITCVLNCSWIYFWHHGQVGYCVALILALGIVLVAILVQLRRVAEPGLLPQAVFGLYAGWVTAASLVNLHVYLSSLNTGISPFGLTILGVLSLAVATLAATAVRWRVKNFLFPLAVAWAGTAIAVKQSGNTAIVVAAAVSVIVCLVLAASFVMEKEGSQIYE